MTPLRLIALFSGLEILAILPIACFPALLSDFIALWGLSNTAAGWVAGIYYLGYMLAVAPLMWLTERLDSRQIFMAGAVLAGTCTLAFGFLAEGLWSALLLRGLAGIGHAAMYMPGLRAMTDRLRLLPGGDSPAIQSRGITVYTASYAVSMSLSYAVTGLLAEMYDWQTAFISVGLISAATAAAFYFLVSPLPPRGSAKAASLSFLPVLRSRDTMGYILAYGAHGFELMALRAWVVAFLVLVLARSGDTATSLPGATALAAIVTLTGLPASFLGNELALRFGRRRTLIWIMTVSGFMGLACGFTATLPAGWVLAFLVLYVVFIAGDSGALTSGMMATTRPETLSAAMALHSIFGFGASILGPLGVGLALDGSFAALGRDSLLAWGLGFSVMGLGALLGPLALWWTARGPVSAGR